MDNFKRYRPKTGQVKSTDGFIRSRPEVPRSDAHTKLRSGTAYTPSSTSRRRIDDFSGPEGFRPVNRNVERSMDVDTSTRLGRQPKRNAEGKIDLGSKEKKISETGNKKRGLLARFRHKLRELYLFNPFNRRNWTKQRAMASALAMVMVGGLVFGGFAWWNLRNILRGGGGAAALQENVDPSLLNGEGDGRVNILLMGRGGPGHEGPDLTDTIVIASINPIQKEAALLSIPRDLYVQSSGGGYTKINEVFANAKNRSLYNASANDPNKLTKAEDAGFKAVEEIVQSKIGIPVHYHAMIDFEGFRKAIDTVGGVSVNVPESATVYENMWILGRNYTLNVKEGQQDFNGLRALAYSRSRKTSPRGDFDRSERQRLILVALKDKIFSLGTFGNPWKMSQLMDDFGKHIRTNISIDEAKRLYEIGNEIPSNKIASVDLVTEPNDHIVGTMINGLSVQIPKAGIDDYSEVKHFVRNRLKDGFLAKENASVAIYNGTMITGIANLTAKDLKSYGYKISDVGDAPTKGVQKTIVVDLRGGQMKYTKRYLENRFGTTAVTKIPDAKIEPGTADFVIILGQNEQTRLAN